MTYTSSELFKSPYGFLFEPDGADLYPQAMFYFYEDILFLQGFRADFEG